MIFNMVHLIFVKYVVVGFLVNIKKSYRYDLT